MHTIRRALSCLRACAPATLARTCRIMAQPQGMCLPGHCLLATNTIELAVGSIYAVCSLQKSGQVDMLVVRYEDLHRNTTGVLKQMADFVGIATSPEQIEWAVQASSADSMRQIERKKGPGFFERKYVKVQQRKGKQFNFVRGASVGKWATVYTPADIQLFMSYAGSMMRKLGYVGYAPAADIT